MLRARPGPGNLIPSKEEEDIKPSFLGLYITLLALCLNILKYIIIVDYKTESTRLGEVLSVE